MDDVIGKLGKEFMVQKLGELSFFLGFNFDEVRKVYIYFNISLQKMESWSQMNFCDQHGGHNCSQSFPITFLLFVKTFYVGSFYSPFATNLCGSNFKISNFNSQTFVTKLGWSQNLGSTNLETLYKLMQRTIKKHKLRLVAKKTTCFYFLFFVEFLKKLMSNLSHLCLLNCSTNSDCFFPFVECHQSEVVKSEQMTRSMMIARRTYIKSVNLYK